MKKVKYKKRLYLMILSICMCLSIVSCGKDNTNDIKNNETEGTETVEQRILEDSERIAGKYRDIYEKAVEDNALESLHVRKEIIEKLGQLGYAAADMSNEVNMENPEQVEQFCRKVEKREKAQVTVITVMDNGGFVRFDLQTSEGKVRVTRSLLVWEEAEPKADYPETYLAYSWEYSEKGYLFFEEYFPPGCDGATGYTVIRTAPLDEKYREWNRKYLEPIGYGLNKLFFTDWSEQDYGDLDLYDLYETLYEMRNGKEAPYEFAYTGLTYEVAGEEFEAVFRTYFQIDSETLRQRTVYNEANHTYRYRPRGMFDCAATADTPYPEVVDCTENDDGTITLMAEAVWPAKSNACAFAHEVTVRPLPDGGFQYVSNHVIPSDKNLEPTWYVERLSDEQWDQYYGDMAQQP